MKRSWKSSLVVAAAMVLSVASAAHAASITLTTANPADSVSGTLVDGQPVSRTWNNVGGIAGLTVTATAWQMAARPATANTNLTSFTSTSATSVTAAGVGQYSGGLGVSTGSETSTGNQHTLDNDGPLEFIEFTFSQAVTVTGITLNNYALAPDAVDGDYTLAFADVNSGTLKLPTATTYYNYNAATSGVETTGFTTFAGSFFDVFATLRADLGPDGNNDGFKIQSLTFSTTSVPLPQSAAMGLALLAGLGGLGLWRRRRRCADIA